MQAFHGVSFSGWNFRALAHGLAFNGGRASNPAAAIIREIAKQGIHRFELGRIDHRAAITAHGHEACRTEPVKMKGQRIRREVECGRDRTGRHALRSRFHKQAEHIKAIVLGECGQGRDNICLFHISTIIEIMTPVKSYFNVC
jgi:hypothetical protein